MAHVNAEHSSHKSPREEEVDDLKVASHSTADYAKFMPQLRPKHMWVRYVAWTILALIVIAGLGAGGWWLSKHMKHAPKASVSNQATTTPQVATTSTTTKPYASNEQSLNLLFKYPSNWTVTPATTSSAESKTITVNSVITNLVDAKNASVVGKAVISIRPGSNGISELNAGTATIAQASTQFSYTQPASDQLQYPYLSYIHYPTDGAAGAFSEVIITGSTQFSQGNSVTSSSLTELDPIISVSFYRCTSVACSGSGAKPLSILPNTWQNNTVLQQVQAVFASMQLH